MSSSTDLLVFHSPAVGDLLVCKHLLTLVRGVSVDQGLNSAIYLLRIYTRKICVNEAEEYMVGQKTERASNPGSVAYLCEIGKGLSISEPLMVTVSVKWSYGEH